MAAHQISIRPGVGMLALFPHMKYQPWYALGELVDNAIQSYVANRDALLSQDPSYRLKVSINIEREDGGTIEVRDNAAGIGSGDWLRAFRVAEPPPDNSGLSQFGIGMKAACCWFAKEWTVTTTALGESVERHVVFDVPGIVATKDETLDVMEASADPSEHFTTIRMTRLHRTPQTKTIGKIKSYLGGIYRQFIRQGDVEIRVNGEIVLYEPPRILVAPRFAESDGVPVEWKKSINVRLASGRQVHGFAALREKGTTASPGLALFYRNKVITGSGEEFYRPEVIYGRSNSFRSQRLFGELHMDDFAVSYTKDSLVWYDEEDEFIQLMKAELDREPLPLLKQAENHRSREVPATDDEVLKEALENIAAALDKGKLMIDPVEEEGTPLQKVQKEAPAVAEPQPLTRSIPVDVMGYQWNVVLVLEADASRPAWLTASRQDSSLELTVNRAHPFMRAYCELPSQDLEPVWRVAIALGLGVELARLAGAKMPGLVTENVNHLLRYVLAQKG